MICILQFSSTHLRGFIADVTTLLDSVRLNSNNTTPHIIAQELFGWVESDENITSIVEQVRANQEQPGKIISEKMTENKSEMFKACFISPREQSY